MHTTHTYGRNNVAHNPTLLFSRGGRGRSTNAPSRLQEPFRQNGDGSPMRLPLLARHVTRSWDCPLVALSGAGGAPRLPSGASRAGLLGPPSSSRSRPTSSGSSCSRSRPHPPGLRGLRPLAVIGLLWAAPPNAIFDDCTFLAAWAALESHDHR